MNKSRIHLINISILAAYMIILRATQGNGVLFASIVPIGVHVFVNMVLFLVNAGNGSPVAKTYLLSAGLVLLIGFSSCVGLALM